MKYTLENRPRKEEQKLFVKGYGKIKATPIFKFDEDAVEQWFEDFEKELREAYQHPEKLTGKGLLISKHKASREDLQYAEGWRQATFRAIKEVLGVEPKIKEEMKSEG
jgi:hypothetical protein